MTRTPASVRRLLVLILSVLLVTPAATYSAATAPVLPDASPEAVLEHLKMLSVTIGRRPAGSAGDQKAIEYVAKELAGLGYAVERQPFPFHYFEEVQAPSLTLTSAGGERINASTMLYSTSTPEGGVEAEVVPAGLGRPGDFEGRAVQGRIALVQRGEIFFSQKVANAASAGAAAVVIYNHQPGGPAVGTLVGPSRIPAVAISRDDGEALLRRVAAGPVRVRLVVRTLSEQRTTYNVIGVKRGTSLPGEIVVVGGHRDSVPVSPGANDNGSGTSAVLEAARLLARVPTARTMHFIAFGAEELGLYGSRHYAQNPPGRVVGMVNMDMVGRGPLQIGNSNDDTRLVDLAEQVARRLGLRVTRFKLQGSSSSDHASFESAGVSTVFIHTGDDPAIHTPNDTFERNDGALMAQAARLAAHVALEAAGLRPIMAVARAEGSLGVVTVNGRVALRIREPAGGLSAVERAEIIAARLRLLLAQGLIPAELAVVTIGGEASIVWRSRLVVTVDANHARLNRSTSAALAALWRAQLAAALSP